MRPEQSHFEIYGRTFVAFFVLGFILAVSLEKGPAFLGADICHALLEPIAFRSVIFLFIGAIALSGIALFVLGADSESSHPVKRWVFDSFAVQPTTLVANLTAPMLALGSAICLVAFIFGYHSAALALVATLVHLVTFAAINWGLRQTIKEQVIERLCEWSDISFNPNWSARLLGLSFLMASIILLIFIFPMQPAPVACES